MLEIFSALKFGNVVGIDNASFIISNIFLKVVDKVIGSDFVRPRLSVLFQLLYVVSKNSSVEFGAADSDIKFVAVEV